MDKRKRWLIDGRGGEEWGETVLSLAEFQLGKPHARVGWLHNQEATVYYQVEWAINEKQHR